jgi:hypothetical protein
LTAAKEVWEKFDHDGVEDIQVELVEQLSNGGWKVTCSGYILAKEEVNDR